MNKKMISLLNVGETYLIVNKNKIEYRTRAIITRSWFEAILVLWYK